MFSGLQELFVIALIIGCLFLLPRIMQRGRQDAAGSSTPVRLRWNPSRPLRFAVVLSVIWLLASIAFFQPWKADTIRFVYVGILPIAALWGVLWVAHGHGKRRPKK
ncbi:MAG: hypothetical protein AMJ54_14155 [Deltaproteobacteria bacterium SG8_13]|nr:MAG: hypothetical protein AMJ54_14155 [Deltaproteobacteria bacterium SG8_13]